MRGKDPQIMELAVQTGITPAYAGKSGYVDVGTACRRDHPRLCGEKIMLTRSYFFILGSPPPMRGKAVALTSKLFQHRITPAYAGKSLWQGEKCVKKRDHPRLCGEKPSILAARISHQGSPPPMRGKDHPCYTSP